jgi:hypothetical protein
MSFIKFAGQLIAVDEISGVVPNRYYNTAERATIVRIVVILKSGDEVESDILKVPSDSRAEYFNEREQEVLRAFETKLNPLSSVYDIDTALKAFQAGHEEELRAEPPPFRDVLQEFPYRPGRYMVKTSILAEGVIAYFEPSGHWSEAGVTHWRELTEEEAQVS